MKIVVVLLRSLANFLERTFSKNDLVGDGKDTGGSEVNSSIVHITSTNWSDLPNELKLKCIKTMPFIARTVLKVTSKTEKALVELIKEKYEFYYVSIKFCSENEGGVPESRLNFLAKSEEFGYGHKVAVRTRRADWGLPVADFFGSSKIEKLEIEIMGTTPQDIKCLDELIQSDVKIHVETIGISINDENEFATQILKKCDSNHLKKIIVKQIPVGQMDEFLKIPQVLGVTTFYYAESIESSEMRELAVKVMNSWKENIYPLGKRAIFEHGGHVLQSILREQQNDFFHHQHGLFSIPTSGETKRIGFFNNFENRTMMFTYEKPSEDAEDPDFLEMERMLREEENAELEQEISRLRTIRSRR